ncbi:MAG: hypothetical protein QM689_07085 [Oscillospiraceae bacterium]
MTSKFKRIVSAVTASIMTLSFAATFPASAAEPERYPYVIFAEDADGGITINSTGLCVNGNMYTNGAYSAMAKYANVNGKIIDKDDIPKKETVTAATTTTTATTTTAKNTAATTTAAASSTATSNTTSEPAVTTAPGTTSMPESTSAVSSEASIETEKSATEESSTTKVTEPAVTTVVSTTTEPATTTAATTTKSAVTTVQTTAATEKTEAYDVKSQMILIHNKLINTYFTSNCTVYDDDYSYSDMNININKAAYVTGKLSLTGNVSLNGAIGAVSDVKISNENLNANNAVIYSKFGDIKITGSQASVSGLIYAPFGTVTINSDNFNLNGIIIAQKVIINSGWANINYSNSVAQIVGTATEELNWSYDDWKFLADTDEDGLPNLIEKEIGDDPYAANSTSNIVDKTSTNSITVSLDDFFNSLLMPFSSDADIYYKTMSIKEFDGETDDIVDDIENYFSSYDTCASMTTSDNSETFIKRWNEIEKTGKECTLFVVNCHGNPTTMFNGITTTEIKSLKKIKCKCLLLLGCNCGHADYMWTNVASALSQKITGVVVASDGTVSSSLGNIFGGTQTFKSKNDDGFKKWCKETRNNKGWLIYQYNSVKKSETCYTTNLEKITIKIILDYLKDTNFIKF